MAILKFSEYVKFITEEIAGEKVCLFIGRLQPVHLGHLKAIEKTSKAFGCKVIVIQIYSEKKESPIPKDLLVKLGDSIAKEYSFIEKYILLPAGIRSFIPDVVAYCQELGYNPIGLGCGEDRYAAYKNQLKYFNTKDFAKVDEFDIISIDRTDDNFSGTATRKAIAEDDKQTFLDSTPKCIHKFYSQLQKSIKQ